MKRTRWIIFYLVLTSVILGSLKGTAQEEKTKAACAQLTVQALNKDVATLNNTQKSAILNLTLSFYNKLDSINRLDSLTLETRQQYKETVHTQYLDSVNSLLTVTQRNDVERSRNARKAAMGVNTEKK
ncbi:MAG: hypothetical protein GXY09_03500 [Bacteroidales bacterium]|nr:hypothetical protein [Bacteroidales bacterium]